jgi:hypothetical protein
LKSYLKLIFPIMEGLAKDFEAHLPEADLVGKSRGCMRRQIGSYTNRQCCSGRWKHFDGLTIHPAIDENATPILKLNASSQESTCSPLAKLTKTGGGGGGQGASLHTIGVSATGGIFGDFAMPRTCCSCLATFSSSRLIWALRRRIYRSMSSAFAVDRFRLMRAPSATAERSLLFGHFIEDSLLHRLSSTFLHKV